MVANDQATRDGCLWLTPHELEKEFNAVKQANLSLGFVTEVSNFAAQGACRYDHNARSCWLNNLKVLRPVFRRENRIGTGSFLAASGVGCIRYDGHRRIRLPYLGNVSMTCPLQDGVADEVAIRNGSGRWYASIGCLQPAMAPPQRETQSVGGVYVGINPLAVDGIGVEYQNPKGYCRAQGRLKCWQRAHARPTPGSRGGQEAQRRIDGAHRLVVGLRDNAHRHVSRALVGKYHTLGIETLNVAGMIRAGLQSRALADAGMSGLLKQVRYKARWYGTRIVAADQWHPNSKTCSACGVVNGDVGREPRWSCPNCGVIHDRKQNAARNLRKLALLAAGEEVMLLDGESRPATILSPVKLPWMKREPSR